MTAWSPGRIAARFIGVGLAFASATCFAADAVARAPSVNDFQRTTFTEKDGAPERTWAITQTNDGWLWFGGSRGLSRFDGVSFEKIDVASADGRLSDSVSALYALPAGGLAIAHMSGGVSIIERGRLQRFDDDAIRALGRGSDFAVDADGVLWASFELGLMRRVDGRWTRVGEDWNLPPGGAYQMFPDVDGRLWIHVADTLVRLARDSRQFETVASVSRDAMLVQGADGMLWAANGREWTCLCALGAVAPRDPAETSRRSSYAYADRDNWFWHMRQGLARPPFPPRMVRDIALRAPVTQFLQDREGNMWVAGLGRVDRLRLPVLRRPAGDTGRRVSLEFSAAFANGQDGRLWVSRDPGKDPTFSSSRQELSRTDGDRLETMTTRIDFGASIGSDREGRVWMATRRELLQWTGRRLEKQANVPAADRIDYIAGLTPGCAGGVWAALSGAGLFRFDGTRWQKGSEIARLPDALPASMGCDKAGHLWLGYGDGRVARVDGDAPARFIDFEGANLGVVSAFSFGRRTLVGGERGLAVLQGARLVRVPTRQMALEIVSGIAEAPDGTAWANTVKGLVRVPGPEIERVAARESEAVAVQLFDASDGYPGLGYSLAAPARTVGRDVNGRIWVATLGGLGYLDPARLPSIAPPTLYIKTLHTATQTLEAVDAALTLPQGTRTVDIAYTALGALHPERLSFRYRLPGVDEGWVEAGARRQAFYTNLPPGAHRFEVDVTDEMGRWSDRPATLAFEIPPTFVQSLAFKLLCAAAAIALVFALHRLRTRQLERRHQRLLAERLDERERIARELHDTLLQGTQGLILKVHSAALLSRQGQPVHEPLERALELASDVIVEARNGIEDLRARSTQDGDLSDSLVDFGHELMHGQPIRFEARIEGGARPLVADVRRQAYLIGREALLNASRHAHPSSIELQIVFADDHLALRVRDDGAGFDSDVLARPPGGRHWGLPGMQERARAIGGTLQIWSRPGAGTEIALRVPGAAAYPSS